MNFSDVKEMYIPVNGSNVEVSQVKDSTGTILWAKSGGGGGLPSGYQQVEYIESGNGQYIDTGLSIWSYCDKLRIEIDMLIPSGAQAAYACQGVGNWGGNYGYYLEFPGGASSNTLQFGSGQYSDAFATTPNDHQRHKYILDCDDEEVYVDTTVLTFNKWNTNADYGNIFLFALGKNNVKQVALICRIYSCKFYDSGTLLRDFVPCYRTSDNVNGLYDLVEGTFYSNPGGTNFVQGNDVN